MCHTLSCNPCGGGRSAILTLYNTVALLHLGLSSYWCIRFAILLIGVVDRVELPDRHVHVCTPGECLAYNPLLGTTGGDFKVRMVSSVGFSRYSSAHQTVYMGKTYRIHSIYHLLPKVLANLLKVPMQGQLHQHLTELHKHIISEPQHRVSLYEFRTKS